MKISHSRSLLVKIKNFKNIKKLTISIKKVSKQDKEKKRS